MKKLFTLLTSLLCSISLPHVNAQDADAPDRGAALSFSGSVDAYFRANLNAGNKGEGYQAPATSFANLPGFSLGMFNLIGTYEGKKTGLVADLVVGPRGEDAVFASPYYNEDRGSSQIINQLYAYWNLSDKVTLTLGNFNTFLGYEVISPVSNFNYSTSYMFSYGPFSHTGLKADMKLSDDFTVMTAVMNPSDMTEFNPFGSYTIGLQVGMFGNTYLNFLYGDQDGKVDNLPDSTAIGGVSAGNTFQADITSGIDLSDVFYLGLNATYNTTAAGQMYDGSDVVDEYGDGAGFYGAAAYLQLKTSERFSFGTRLEYFRVFNHGLDVITLDTDGDGSVVDITFTGNASIGNLTIIPELRFDVTSEDSFLDNDLAPSNTLASFVLAAVYSFNSLE